MQITERLIPVEKKKPRPGILLAEPTQITIHYIGPYIQDVETPRRWWITGPDGAGVQASSHYIVGRDGKCILCIPENEVAWTNGNNSNYYSINIEVCPESADGKFSGASIQTLKELIAGIRSRHPAIKKVNRHYDETKKQCPAYYCPRLDDESGEQRWQELRLALGLEAA